MNYYAGMKKIEVLETEDPVDFAILVAESAEKDFGYSGSKLSDIKSELNRQLEFETITIKQLANYATSIGFVVVVEIITAEKQVALNKATRSSESIGIGRRFWKLFAKLSHKFSYRPRQFIQGLGTVNQR
jgi:hypothetical protein